MSSKTERRNKMRETAFDANSTEQAEVACYGSRVMGAALLRFKLSSYYKTRGHVKQESKIQDLVCIDHTRPCMEMVDKSIAQFKTLVETKTAA